MAQKFEGSLARKAPGRPRMDGELETLVIRLAQENRTWGYDRIAGALKHLGYTIMIKRWAISLRRQGIPPAPERKHPTRWQDFIHTRMDMLVATDAERWVCSIFLTRSITK
jgi:hypothetical protein